MKPSPTFHHRSSRAHRCPSGLRLALLLLAVALHSGGGCSSSPLLSVTLNAIPDAMNDVLVVPPHGFTVDVSFTNPEQMHDGAGTTLRIESLDGTSVDYTDALVASGPAGAPLAGGQWVHVDFAGDLDDDGVVDLQGDLEAFGLYPAAGGDLGLQMLVWAISEIVSRAESFYTTPNPSGLPGGDAADVTFELGPNPSGPTTRVCVGGADPTGGPSIGAVLFDPGNANRAQVACDAVNPSGVFPGELMVYSSQPAFQTAFAPVLASPVGADPLDPVVLGGGYDPGDPEQLARRTEIETALHAFAQAVATILAHEVGHALGLVPPGAPGGGLFGGSSGPAANHNQLPEGGNPPESLLMNRGSTFQFSELSGVGAALPTIRELNWAYLRGRLVLDPLVTGIFPAPAVDACTPTEVSLSGYPLATLVCHGEGLLPTPTIRLAGPIVFTLSSAYWVDETEVQATVSLLQLVPGVYDVELTNPDGQQAVLEDALVVTP